MKKVVSLILAFAMVFAFGDLAQAQNASALKKAQRKEYKAKKKEFKKGKWSLYASSRSFDVMLLKHYQKLEEEGISEVVGVAQMISNKGVGHQVCINDACRTYAQSAGSHVKGRIVSDLGADGEDSAAEFDHFYSAYERLVESEIKGELVESFTIIRQTGVDAKKKPVYEMQTYFVVDVNAATQARIRAFENAAKESAAAQKYAQKVSDFIKEGFSIEK